jgi:hypothetical protein
MNTTRTAMRASALTATLAALLFGAPATAFADTPTPAPPPPGAGTSVATTQLGAPAPPPPAAAGRKPCFACNPELTGTNSGASDASGNHPIRLDVSGRNFTPNNMVQLDVWVDGHHASCGGPPLPADGSGVIDSDSTGCHTDALAAPNGYVQATDVFTGKQTPRLSVMVYEH